MKGVLITGGARRFGNLLCSFFKEKGFRVAYTYLKGEEPSPTRELLPIRCDLTKISECENLIHTLEEWGGVEVLINNASLFYPTSLEALKEDFSSFDEMVNLHLRAPLFLSSHLGLKMKRNGWGRIVNMIDHTVPDGRAYDGFSCYHLSKYGLYGMSQSLALELAPEVTVNCVAPGFFLPPDKMKESRVKELSQKHLLKQTPSEQEIAEDLWHLVKSDSKTGTVLKTNAGASLPYSYLQP